MEPSKERGNSEVVHESEKTPLHGQNHTLSLIVVGTETALFDRTSKVRERILAYTKPFKEVHIIILCKGHYTYEKTNANTFLYPTNSAFPPLGLIRAFLIARRIVNTHIVTAQDPFETGIVAWMIARSKHAALHVQVHTDFFAPAYGSLSLLNRLRVMVAGFVMRRAARVRVVSDRVKQEIESRYHINVPISVLPIFVDTDHFRYRVPEGELVERFAMFSSRVLVMSRLEPEKDVAFAIRTFAENAPVTSCLIIVGDGNERPSLESLVKTLPCRERIFFEGWQDPSAYYKIADLVLVTSRYEGYGLVIIEALAAGTPVISSDVGIAREAGAIVTSFDEFPEKLVSWFHNGPREMHLKNYPYKDFDEYVQAYCDDIMRCVEGR